jgi:hypothetical protein
VDSFWNLGAPVASQAPLSSLIAPSLGYVPNVTFQREGACYSDRSGARVENGCISCATSERSTCRKVVGERVIPRDVDPDLRPR